MNTISAICGSKMPLGKDLKGIMNEKTESCATMAEHLYRSIESKVSEDLTTRVSIKSQFLNNAAVDSE